MKPLQQRVQEATFKKWVLREHARLKAKEETLNLELRARMLKSWELERPKMYARLKSQGIVEQTADVLQAKMWQAEEKYQAGGMPYPDSKEQAEREWLLLEPESEDQQEDQNSPILPSSPG
jgi:hypothetical protein